METIIPVLAISANLFVFALTLWNKSLDRRFRDKDREISEVKKSVKEVTTNYTSRFDKVFIKIDQVGDKIDDFKSNTIQRITRVETKLDNICRINTGKEN